MSDARVAVGATGLLARFNDAGALAAADVQVARRLARLCGEADERVLLAVALTVRAVRGGSVCLPLADRAEMLLPEAEDLRVVQGLGRSGPLAGAPPELSDADLPDPSVWAEAVAASPMVAGPGRQVRDHPVRLVDGRLYLDRYWRAEESVREHVDARLSAPVSGIDPLRVRAAVHRLFGGPGQEPDNAGARVAAAAAVNSRFTVLSGGPGTGKTTAVAGVVAVLQAVAGPGLRVALAAPTGKAAARLQEAVRAQVAALPDADRHRVGELTASTVHRLLGWRAGSMTRFRHDRDHHLPHDVVVVDETSMVSLPLMAALLQALRPQTRLVLVGDPDQLASVEAGAVLGDLVARPRDSPTLPRLLAESVEDDLRDRDALRSGVIRLTVERRFGSVIGSLARAVRDGDEDEVLARLRAGDAEVTFVEPAGELLTEAEVAGVRSDAERAGLALVRAARAGDAAAALAALESHRLLLAHRRGPFGVAQWAARVENWVAAADGRPEEWTGAWYPGRPLLVTANDRDTGLYNGDAGVVITDPGDPTGESVLVVFGDPANPKRVRPYRLPPVETVHAMTVHRSQGSQFDRISVILPSVGSPLLTRELLYTALTRARVAVRVVAGEQAVRHAVRRRVRRASGLRFG